ncbi:MAG: hypothetical protein QM813_06900 [Verrucomicrobiota bacterium]
MHKDFERDYWLEFRNRLSANPSFRNGLLLTWSAWSATGGSGLVDTQPATLSRLDAPVVIGRTFSDHIAAVPHHPARPRRDGDRAVDRGANQLR